MKNTLKLIDSQESALDQIRRGKDYALQDEIQMNVINGLFYRLTTAEHQEAMGNCTLEKFGNMMEQNNFMRFKLALERISINYHEDRKVREYLEARGAK